MKTIQKFMGIASIAASICGTLIAGASGQTLTGAGSTFVNPIMSRWIQDYATASGATVNYQAVGSGAGITDLINHTVDFAGSDVPMNPNELASAKAPVMHIPDVVGAVVVAYDVPGIGPGLHFTGDVLEKIYHGDITMWNDPAIVALNPGTTMPAQSIFVAHRSDGSGTTAIFTDYLSKVSKDWKSAIGSGKSVDWPVGLGGKGNAGVSGLLHAHKYCLGYIELAYAVQNDIPYAAIENRKGNYIYPSVKSAATAAAGVKVAPDMTASLTDSPASDGYPITGYSYLIVYKSGANISELKKFLTFVLTTGQGDSYTAPLLYAPIPDSVAKTALARVNSL